MVAAVKQIVKVQRGGVIRLQSNELKAGDKAEVIVLVPDHRKNGNGRQARRESERKYPVARMTKQTRGDIAWAKKIMSDPTEIPVPYAAARKRLGLA